MTDLTLANLLEQKSGLNQSQLADLLVHWNKNVSLKRNDYLIQRGKVENFLYFVQSGALRLFYPTENEEICIGFAYSPSFICSFPSFIRHQPSEYYIQALRKTEVTGISRTHFYAFMQTNLMFERFWYAQIEQALLGRIEREIDLLLPDPEQRLQRLRSRSPHIFQLVPHKYIASYLRMKPETLSRLPK
jgi:CRP-like cAMP-binding protein